MSDADSKLRQDLISLFALGLLFRLALLILFPIPYGNDAAGRLFFRDTLFMAHWLPLTQALVYLTFAATADVFIVRLVFAIAGSVAAVAYMFFLQMFATRRAALMGGVLFTVNAHAVFLSLMPYQEVVFLGLLFGSIALLCRAKNGGHSQRDFTVGSVLYGLACLTRYEAWFILPALLLVGIWPALVTRRLLVIGESAGMNLLGLGWGPVLWLLINWLQWGSPTAFLFHRADHAFYAWSPHGEIERIADYAGTMLYWLLRFGSPFILFALPGIWMFWRKRHTLFPFLWPLLLLFILELSFLTFVAGNEFATANRFAMTPLGIVLVFAALGMDDLVTRLEHSSHVTVRRLLRPVPRTVIASALVFVLLVYGAVPVVQANRAAVHRAPYEIAKFLKAHLTPDDSAILVAASFDGEVPMPYQRVFGQLDFGTQQLLCSSFFDPDSLESVLVRPNLRYIVYWHEDQSSPTSRHTFQRTLHALSNKSRIVFRNNVATIYQRISS